ncbi:MAG: N(4)-(beta-N-acetylglucosaminyl)-L-asparaginase [Phycisphaerales bacterium JB059]
MNTIDRRRFLGVGALGAGAALTGSLAHARPSTAREDHPGDEHRGPCVIASGNGLAACDRAWERLRDGADPAAAVVDGVGLIEADENDMTVGYGGLPNEDGVVQLDASVMHGPSHKAGAVACLENIKHPAAVALKVLTDTDHVLLVGEGAKRFAVRHGFPEENLLTEKAREAWLRWKRNASPHDDWLDADQAIRLKGERIGQAEAIPFTYGTIHCGAVDGDGDLGATTTTSGLSYKIPGRVGDSPIIGAGMYVDNEVGSAGATGRGEAVIQSCGAFLAVRFMEQGMTPTEACLAVLRHIDARTKRKDLRDAHGRPNFNVVVYALRKDGAYGGAVMRPGARFAVRDTTGPARLVACAPLHP